MSAQTKDNSGPRFLNQGVEDWPSVNACVQPLVDRLRDEAQRLRVGVTQTAGGASIIDCGLGVSGGLEAGRLMAEICMGGLGNVAIRRRHTFKKWHWSIDVTSSNPVLACLASQYAGWKLSEGDFFALGSGPARALARAEPLYEELRYADDHRAACLVLEADQPPPETLIASVAERCAVPLETLTVLFAPVTSLAGTVQVVARVLEVGLHKVHELGFPLDRVIDGMGSAPLPPPGSSFISGMGRTNDAIIYGGDVHLFVTGPEDEARDLAEKLPSTVSEKHGETFADIFAACNGDFYAIDGALFSPAKACVTCLDTGRSFHAGHFDEALLDRSFA